MPLVETSGPEEVVIRFNPVTKAVIGAHYCETALIMDGDIVKSAAAGPAQPLALVSSDDGRAVLASVLGDTLTAALIGTDLARAEVAARETTIESLGVTIETLSADLAAKAAALAEAEARIAALTAPTAPVATDAPAA